MINFREFQSTPFILLLVIGLFQHSFGQILKDGSVSYLSQNDSILFEKILKLHPEVQRDSVVILYESTTPSSIDSQIYANKIRTYSRVILAYAHRKQFAQAYDLNHQILEFVEGTPHEKRERYLYSFYSHLTFIQGMDNKYEDLINTLITIKAYYEKNDLKAQLVRVYDRLGTAYTNIEKLELAREYYNLAIQVADEIDEPIDKAISKFNLGFLEYEIDNLSIAIKLFEEAEQIYASIVYPNNPFLSGLLAKMGSTYSELGMPEKAEEYYHKALALESSGTPLAKAKILSEYAISKIHQKDYKACIEIINRSLNLIGYNAEDFASTSLNVNSALVYNRILYQAYYGYWQRDGIDSLLQKSYETVLNAFHILRELVLGKAFGAYKSALVSKHQYVIENILEIGYAYYQTKPNAEILEEIFGCLDLGKNITFYENLHLRDLWKLNQDTILSSQEDLLRSGLYELNQKKSRLLRQDSLDLQAIESVEFKIDSSLTEYDLLVKKIELIDPEFIGKNHLSKIPNIQRNIMNGVDQETILLNYYLTDSVLYTFVTTSNDINLHKEEIALNLHIDSCLKYIKNGVNDEKLINQSLRILNRSLFENPLEGIERSFKRIIISPHKKLELFPMEVVYYANSLNEFDIPISYRYSIRNHQHSSPEKVKSISIFAPSYNEERLDTSFQHQQALLVRNGTYNLPGARAEATSIEKIIGGKLFVNSDATKKVFKTQATESNLIHLAMHTFIDGDDPFSSSLHFTNEGAQKDYILTMNDVLGLNLSSELIVLSACNTGVGKIIAGEGVRNLAKAFSYGGSKSTIMSLWKIPDQSSSLIMSAFYRNLKKGLQKDVALAKAKKEYLEVTTEPELRHPYYWAGYILQGDYQELNWETSFLNICLFFISILLISIILFWRRNMKRRRVT